MKPNDPILLSSILEYYLQQNSLKRSKKELIKQMKDILIISQFLINRIPPMMKTIKQTVKVQQKNIKMFNEGIKQKLFAVIDDPQHKKLFFLDAAYQKMNHFTFTKERDKDFIEKTIADKQFKLKFLQSQNLPSDFYWHRLTKSIKQTSSSPLKPGKQVMLVSYWNHKVSLFEVNTKKFRIFIGLKVQNNRYVWQLQRIEQRINRQIIGWMKSYFQQQIVPLLKIKHKKKFEQNFLASISRYSVFLQLMECNLQLCRLDPKKRQFYCSRIVYQQNGKKYELLFSNPKQLEAATLIISQAENDNIMLKLTYKKQLIKGQLFVQNDIVFTTGKEAKFDNFPSLIDQFQNLIEYSQRFKKFMKFMNLPTPSDYFKKHTFIKLSGVFWLSGYHADDDNWISKTNSHVVTQDGIYIGESYFQKLLFVQITACRYLSSQSSISIMLNKLAKVTKKFTYLLYFNYIFESLFAQNKQKQSQLDHFSMNQQKVFLYFRKKVCAQDIMIKVHSQKKTTNTEQQQAFNSIKFSTEIDVNFETVLFYSFRDPDQKVKFERQEWKSFIRYEDGSIPVVEVQKIIFAIKYLQENIVLKYVFQRKLRNQSKSIYSNKI